MHQSRESLRLLWVDPSVCFSFGFLLEIIYMLCLVTQSSVTLCKSMDCSLPGFTVHGDSPGKNTEVGCLSFLQESSQSRDQTQVSCIAGRFFTIWATRELSKWQQIQSYSFFENGRHISSEDEINYFRKFSTTCLHEIFCSEGTQKPESLILKVPEKSDPGMQDLDRGKLEKKWAGTGKMPACMEIHH